MSLTRFFVNRSMCRRAAKSETSCCQSSHYLGFHGGVHVLTSGSISKYTVGVTARIGSDLHHEYGITLGDTYCFQVVIIQTQRWHIPCYCAAVSSYVSLWFVPNPATVIFCVLDLPQYVLPCYAVCMPYIYVYVQVVYYCAP